MSDLAPPLDEMVDGTRRLRPHWQRLFGTISDLGIEALAERGRHLDHLLAEEGIGSLLPGTAPLRWRCDPVPLPLAAAEFAALEAGLAQRVRLLEAVLEDLYGPQSLLAAGALPPALVYANPAFLRACRTRDATGDGGRGGEWPARRHLHLYAADLLRGPDGAWRVLADRTADAAGAGYALENRRAMVRVLPELFGAARQLSRLSPHFETLQDTLQRLAPGAAAGNPRLALLTPGPASKLWFEHVVLARELSCTLVEGGDLTVRDGTLFLKTLHGLQRVDLLLRHQDGRTLDPLEQDPGAAWGGVPGLLDAARSGAVRLVNEPGAGFAEAPALAAFLPALARRLLGEELRLPGVETLWLGEAAARERVLADPAAWRLRPALDGKARQIPLARLSDTARGRLMGLLAAAPDSYVACAQVAPSVAPCLGTEGGLVPQPVVLRLFLLFDGARWRALPGGLARALTAADAATGKLPLHGLAKDVWVLAEDLVDIHGPARLPAVAALPIRHATGELPSRVADNFFWLGRYLERAEGAARLLRITAEWLERPAPTPREAAELKSLADCLVAAELAQAEEVRGVGPGLLTMALLRAAREGGVLPDLLLRVSRMAERLRDRLTGEVHAVVTHELRALLEALRALPPGREGPRGLEPLAAAMARVLGFAAMMAGLAAENMVRGGGRLFLDLGRRVERAQAIAAELACVLDQPGAAAQPARLEPGLRLALVLRDSVITYSNRYLTVLQPAPVLDLVLAEEGNPRGLAFQLAAARDMLAALEGEASGGADPGLASTAARLLAAAQAMPREAAAASPEEAAAAAGLPPRLRTLAGELGDLSDGITRSYFALLPPARSLGIEAEARRLRGAA